ncbi:hypothetical protein BG004_005268, partial [Podila humilis]
ITGEIPKEFGNCKDLAIMFVAGFIFYDMVTKCDNHLTGGIPDSLYTLRGLKSLDVPSNKLSGELSSKIGNMAGLTRLILSHNDFNGTLPVEIQNLTRLEYMAINYNSFNGIFPIAMAPSQLTSCLVQPNAFQGCPSNDSVENPATFAYQCNLDCSGE